MRFTSDFGILRHWCFIATSLVLKNIEQIVKNMIKACIRVKSFKLSSLKLLINIKLRNVCKREKLHFQELTLLPRLPKIVTLINASHRYLEKEFRKNPILSDAQSYHLLLMGILRIKLLLWTKWIKGHNLWHAKYVSAF